LELTVTLKAAWPLRLTTPQSILLHAYEVVR
jgi:hypothetical protein